MGQERSERSTGRFNVSIRSFGFILSAMGSFYSGSAGEETCQGFRTSTCTWVSEYGMDKGEEADHSLSPSSMFPNPFSAPLCPALCDRRPTPADYTFWAPLNQTAGFKQWEAPAKRREMSGRSIVWFLPFSSLLCIASLVFPTGQPFLHSSCSHWASISSFLPPVSSVL